MNNTSKKRTQQMSLVGQLKRRLLTVASLLIVVLIFFFPVGLLNVSRQHALDERQVALQEDLSNVLLGMVNQETGLRGYITTDNIVFLQPFTSGRSQYLFAVQQVKEQAQGSDFRQTITVLARVEERADTWYSTYSQPQLKNMQSGRLATAREASTLAAGKILFDQFRASVAHLHAAVEQDLSTIQWRFDVNNKVTLTIAAVLSAFALLILWFTFTFFVKALQQLTTLKTTTNQFGSGDLSARVRELTYQELNSLGRTFNMMADDLTARTHELERTSREVREQRDELVTVNKTLEEANRVRDQFLSTMSHELRTPLASIIGFSEMLLEDATPAGWNPLQQDNLECILKNGEHLLNLINDVLDLSKIEAGRMMINYTQVDVKDLLASVTEEIQSLAITRNLVLRIKVEEEIGCLETNMMKLRQILLNLLSNALKFTEQGEVTLSATRTSRKGTACIAFAVKDTGIGIPLGIQEHIYEAFYQADGSYTRKFGGTGLGLSIVSQLTTLLGGTITLKSAPGQGSTFTVLLPIKAVHQYVEQDTPRLHVGQRQEVPTSSLSSHEHVPTLCPQDFVPRGATDGQHHLILAVDDNPDVIVLIKTALQDMSYTVVGEQDPLKVMELVQEMRPCAITLDVMMPGLNGWQILHQLRDNPATASIPVVMLTVLSEQTTGYVLGADDYVIKPFKKDVLCNTLQRLIEAKQDSSQANKRETQQV